MRSCGETSCKRMARGVVLHDTGQIGMWAETSVLNPGDLQCEAVGCLEETGMMAFKNLDGFYWGQRMTHRT